MGFRLVGFSAAAHGASDVEVAQAGVAKTVYSIHPEEHFFHQQLRFTVGIGGAQRHIFRDGGYVGFAVNRGCRGEDEPVDACGNHGFEKSEGGGAVVAKVELRMAHAFACLNERGKMHDSVESGGQKFFEVVAIGNLALDEIDAWRKQFPGGMAEVVVDDDSMALLYEGESDHPPNVPSPASDQNSQDSRPPILYAI